LENLELFLKQKASGKLNGSQVDVQELIQALLDNVVGRAASAKKGSHSMKPELHCVLDSSC
jgi:hypothetical protein